MGLTEDCQQINTEEEANTRCRSLGNTGLKVSEIGLGAGWLERHNVEEAKAMIDCCEEQGISILNYWISGPDVCFNVGAALEGRRDKWIIQGHLGSTWQNGQYVRTQELSQVKAAFMGLLERLRTDYIDLGMIHLVDESEEFHRVMDGEFIGYVRELKESGVIRHIGMSTYNPAVARLTTLNGEIEMILFNVSPAFDMLPATNGLNKYFERTYGESLGDIVPGQEGLYRICEQRGTGITVMKDYAGGYLFSTQTPPFGVALTSVQCLHYALTRPAATSMMTGYDTSEYVMRAVAHETASGEEKDYASVLVNAPHHTYSGQCTYCDHCTSCPSGIDIAVANKLYDLAIMQKEVPTTMRAYYASLSANADGCIDCQNCGGRCPFGILVVERMEKTRELLGEK